MTPDLYALPTFTKHLLGDVVDDVDTVDPQRPLAEQFADSVVIIELCVTLEELGVDIALIDLANHPTLADLYDIYVDHVIR